MNEIVTATPNAGRHYYLADGKRVYLQPSRRFVAVHTPETTEARSSAMGAFKKALPMSLSRQAILEVPEYRLALLEIASSSNTLAATEIVRGLSGAGGIETGPAVYETATSPSPESLVDVSEVLVQFKSGTPEATRQAILDRHHLAIKQTDYPEPGSYLAATRASDDTLEIANSLNDEAEVEAAQPNFLRLMPRLTTAEAAVASPVGTSRVYPFPVDAPASEEAEPELRLDQPLPEQVPLLTPGDPSFPTQWGLRKVRAPEAWDISLGTPAISIAVIDEGCNLAHEDIQYKLPGYDAVTGTDNQEPQPADGHGTACAGIAAARANNSRGGVGIAPSCRILPVRIARGVGGGWYTTDAMIADGLRTAVNRGADVLSNSWGGGAPSTPITNALRYAQTNGRGGRGCPTAIATANSDVRGVAYPANLSPTIPGLLAVGASNEWDERKSRTSRDGETWWGSNYGPEVDVVAPGVHIFTTDIMGGGGYGTGNYVPNFNGTSSATPHVAGLMALILSVDPGLRAWEVEDIIKLTAIDLGGAGRDEHFGFGRIDCRRALEAASRVWSDVTATPEFLGTGRECFMRMNVRVFNPGINTVRLDSLTISSHTADWSTVVDRFEYRPNPGGLMAPRSGHDVRLNRLLLKANGNASAWTYRWSASWTYTFWRPSAAALPFSAEAAAVDGTGITAQGQRRGARDRASGASLASDRGISNGHAPTRASTTVPSPTKQVEIDPNSGQITIVIR